MLIIANLGDSMLKTVWIALVAFNSPEECDRYVELNSDIIIGEIQCVIQKYETPPIKPKRKPKASE